MWSPLVAVGWLVAGAVWLPTLPTAQGDAEVMSHVTAHFGQSLEECREESGLTADLMESFNHFWLDEYELVDRELGCAIICMSDKFSLMHDDTKIHHDNLEDYIRSFPNGEVLANKMVKMIHTCEQEHLEVSDDCARVVRQAACFKARAKADGIAPEVAMIEAVLEQYQ